MNIYRYSKNNKNIVIWHILNLKEIISEKGIRNYNRIYKMLHWIKYMVRFIFNGVSNYASVQGNIYSMQLYVIVYISFVYKLEDITIYIPEAAVTI